MSQSNQNELASSSIASCRDGQLALRALEEKRYTRAALRASLLLRGEQQQKLFALARSRRAECFAQDLVEVRSVIEISNICAQRCAYCNIGAMQTAKYIIPCDEFQHVVRQLHASGRRVLLVQSGENRAQSFVDHVSRCIADARAGFPDLAFVLCLGNLSRAQYRQLRQAGADRYILKFETSDADLYSELKPHDDLSGRTACIEALLELGFQVGSGNIVGLPGQTLDTIVDDILFAGRFPLSMVSATVFVPGAGSRLQNAPPGDVETALNCMALLRILYPERLMPTTSSLEKRKPDGQYWGLMAGANTVTIHDGTPEELRALFPIYSARRFTPNAAHLARAVARAGMRLGKEALL